MSGGPGSLTARACAVDGAEKEPHSDIRCLKFASSRS